MTRESRIRKKVLGWYENCDHGMSSCAIAWHCAGVGWPENYTPCDPSDFLRCYRLLQAVPELRRRLGRMRKVSAAWGRVVDHWDELEELLREEIANPNSNAPKLFKRMHELRL